MRRYLVTVLAMLALVLPMQSHAQTGDASILENLEGLEQAIGRSWVTPLQQPSLDNGSIPAASPEFEVLSMNAIIFEFDSSDNANAALEKFNDDHLLLIENDPNTPASEPFETEGLGDAAFGYEGTFPMPSASGEMEDMAVVSLNVQQDNLVIQLFGSIVPGNHIDVSTQIAEDIMAAEIGPDDPVLDESGASTGGLWEKLNAVEFTTLPDVVVFDLQIYPLDGAAVQGSSVTVPEIDLDHISAVPGLVGSWYTAYGTVNTGTPQATPVSTDTGPFSIELWVMEFEDPAHASAAAFSMQESLSEPLRIVSDSGGGLDGDESGDLTIELTGFTGKDLPAGDAGVVIRASGTTVYAARVYTREPAPTPIARNLVNYLVETPAGTGDESIVDIEATGSVWDRFPEPGNDLLYDLDPIMIRHDEPSDRPAGTPVG